MRTRPLLPVLLGVLVAMLAACSGEGSDAFVHVGMKDNFYTRDVTRVAVGDSVHFSNDGLVPHNAIDLDGAWSTGETSGGTRFDVMQPGDEVDITFAEPGVYRFYCSLHATDKGEGMSAVIVVGDVEYSAAGDKAPAAPVEAWTGVTRNVPDEYPTIQNAVDAADPGDLVLVAPAPQDDEHLASDGKHVYKEQVDVTTPYITIRGTDRDEVIIDGEFTRANGINVAAADGVAVENMTSRYNTINGFFWTSLTGYRGSYLTAYNNGVYGIYAFDSDDGLFEHSYASGHPDGGFYIGQCDPCKGIIDHSVSEWNGLGYSGTNSSGELYLLRSVWRDNQAGIVPNTLDSELLPPVHDVTVMGNYVEGSGNTEAPALLAEFVGSGNGILLAGGRDSVIERNRVVNSTRSGILLTPNLDENFWMGGGNRVESNAVEASGYADITLGGPGLGDDCFVGNHVATTAPPGLEQLQGCDGLRLPWRWELASTFMTLGRFAEASGLEFPINDWKTVALPGPQEQMPGGVDAPVVPAYDVFDRYDLDLDSIATPDVPAGVEVGVTKEFTVFGVPLAAGFWSVFFGLYGWLLPFVLLAAWTALALWDISRRDDLSKGAAIGWIAIILIVPFVGPVAYHLASRSPLPGWLRGAMIGGGLAAYLVILGIGAVVGGIV